MQFLPPRRWFQFRLSTAFVLVGILCWMLSCRPYLLAIFGELPFAGDDIIVIGDARFPNPALLWPTLALAVFVGWKLACAFTRFQVQRGSASTRPCSQRRWYQFRISTWLIIIWFIAALSCRPYLVSMVGRALPYDDDSGYTFLVGEHTLLHPTLAFLLPVLAALLGWKAVGAVERFKRSNASNLATEFSGP